MSETGTSERAAAGRRLWLRRADADGIWWAVACCWLAVWGNYGLIELGLTASYIVPFDLFVVPAIVSAGFWAVRRLRRS